ncbi:MAG TPA: chemotaxis protein CheB [Sphingomonas sp.]|nr:chemotaxis protein CheB [Sphingomonas sp.]
MVPAPSVGISPALATRPARTVGRVLIVDDSVVARAVIARAVESSADFAVVGAVASAQAALTFLQVTPVDFVLLDMELRGGRALAVLPDIIQSAAGAKVIVISSDNPDRNGDAVQALALGAADRINAPMLDGSTGGFPARLLAKLEALWGDAVRTAAPTPISPLPFARPVQRTAIADGFDPGAFDIIAIGASTGGIHALSTLLRALPVEMRLPILITQHLPASFMPYFAAQVAVLAGRPCDVATDCMRVRPGRIVVAPGDAHIRCVALPDRSASTRLIRDRSLSGCMPSVDPMMASLPQVFGARVLAVMLSGMGRDGADGARAIRDAGGYVLAQDRATSVVWGMPGACADVARALLSPDAIGALLARCGRGA